MTTPKSPRVWTKSRVGVLGSIVGAVAVRWQTGCQLFVDTDADQCHSDADCASKGASLAGYVCGDDHVCAVPGGACSLNADCRLGDATSGDVCTAANVCAAPAFIGECAHNQDCIAKAGGKPALCRASDRACVALTSDDCEGVFPEGAAADDGVLLVGSLLPLKGVDASTGLPKRNAVRLAVGELQERAAGLPGAPGGARRPLAFVSCDTSQNVERAARFLVDQVGVPAVIGPAFSGDVIDVANTTTIRSGVLLIAPSATSPSITDLDDHDLVWRTAPSDVIQSKALVAFVPSVEVEARKAHGVPEGEKAKLALVYKNDAYGQALADLLTKGLKFNGSAVTADANRGSFLAIDYVPTDAKSLASAVASVRAFAPDVVMLLGAAEVSTSVLTPLDPMLAKPPYYVLSDAAKVEELLAAVTGGAASLRARVRGTSPGTETPTFDQFRARYQAQNYGTDPNGFGVAGSYDATYLLSLALSALAGGAATGPTLAAELKGGKTVKGDAFDVADLTTLPAVLTRLAGGGTVAYTGASGPLKFDLATGEAPSNIDVWCVASGSPAAFISSGGYYDASAGRLVGTVSCD